jgi:predicted RNA-binding Zn-ribbon protein involved in translation (DUF1610 family)
MVWMESGAHYAVLGMVGKMTAEADSILKLCVQCGTSPGEPEERSGIASSQPPETDLSDTSNAGVACPSCGSDAFYRYGRTRNGKQRFRCLLCGRQFVMGSSRKAIRIRPFCPTCGRLMHLYMVEGSLSRFRCSGYPSCRMYLKIILEDEK